MVSFEEIQLSLMTVDEGYSAVLSRIIARRKLLEQSNAKKIPVSVDEDSESEEEDCDDGEFQIDFVQSKVEKFKSLEIPSRREQFIRDQEELKNQYFETISLENDHLMFSRRYDGRKISGLPLTLEYIVVKNFKEALAELVNILQKNVAERIWILNDNFVDLTKIIQDINRNNNLSVKFPTSVNFAEQSVDGVCFCDTGFIRKNFGSVTIPDIIVNFTCLGDRVEFLNRFFMFRQDEDSQKEADQLKIINMGGTFLVDELKNRFID